LFVAWPRGLDAWKISWARRTRNMAAGRSELSATLSSFLAANCPAFRSLSLVDSNCDAHCRRWAG
jgi:hypothetical protein